jgi:uncharacterized membrane protein YbhN (UPF0104 family)
LIIIEKIIRKLNFKSVDKIVIKIVVYINQVKNYKKLKTNFFALNLFLMSLINWLLIYLTFFLIIRSFSLNYSFVQVIFATSLANFTMLIPLSLIGGIGTFEAGWTAGFMMLGMQLETAVAIGLFTNIFGLIISGFMAAFGYLYLFFNNK